QPNYVETYLAAGELALSKHDYQLAGDNFQQAAKLDPKNAEAHFGVARSFAPSNTEKADTALKLALECNPHHIPSHLFIAANQIDAEQYADAEKTLAEVAAINPQHTQVAAYRAVIAHLKSDLPAEEKQRTAALAHWKENPEVDHLIGLKLS